MMPSNYLIFFHPLLLIPSIFPSLRVFSNKLALRIRWPKYWSFSFSISPSNEYSGFISFRIDWLDFSVQGTLKSLLQLHSLKASIQCSAFFMVQLSDPYMTTGGQETGKTEDEMVGWHHRLDGHGFEKAPGDDAGQRSLACCRPWGRK